jgi:hypothetical protein
MIRERIKALRREATDLEATAVEEGRAENYRTALRAERHTVEQHLARARSHPADERELLANPFSPMDAAVEASKTWGQRAARLEQRINNIATELDRVTSA